MELPTTDEITNSIPELKNIKQLASGGQKTVYKAQHTKHGQVVLKIIRNTHSDARVLREIEINSEFKFNNVPTLYQSGFITQNNGQVLYLLEQYIEGETLRDLLKRVGKLNLKDTLHLLKTLLTIAVQLEDKQIVHRDIKPENIIVGKDKSFWLLDFGIARYLNTDSLTSTGQRFGPHTVGYAAPEQYNNVKKEVDGRADLFSIGVVVYEAYSGIHPFRNGTVNTAIDIYDRIETVKPKALKIIGDSENELSEFLQVLINAYPSQRPQSSREALEWYQDLLISIDVS